MKSFSVSVKEKLKRLDLFVIFCVLTLSLISIITIAGSPESFGKSRLTMQALASGVGFITMIFISTFDYQEVVGKMFFPFLFFSIGFLALTLLVGSGDGNKSWLEFSWLPFSIQPSEFVKITFIITFAKHLELVKDNINHIKNVAALAVHAGAIVGLVLLSKDLGVALVYMGIVAIMLFSAGLSLWYFAFVIIAVVIAFPYLWDMLAEYQQMRILVGFDPQLDPIKYGYQPLRSELTIAAGGMWGHGVDGGTLFKSLPAKQTDFFFSVIAEKFGFFGSLFVIAIYIALVIRLIVIARNSRKDLGSYICIGAAATIIIQASENIGMCLAMLPVVGITLPFLSYGGSSVLASYILIGVVLSVRAHKIKYFFERENL